MPTTNFTLDRSLFNKEFYTRLHDLWFKDVPTNAATAPMPVMKRWFGMGGPEEKAAFDEACATHTREVLESISPQKLVLPPFESHETDEKNAASLSAPFLQEVKQAQEMNEKDGADTLLALLLLLDQMPRNIYRDADTLKLVYNHYDRLSVALLRSSMKLTPNPVDYPDYQLRPVVLMWSLMPLVHSEQLSAHELWMQLMKETETRLLKAGHEDIAKSMKGNYDAEVKHVEPLRQFGRYPHRNAFVGRQNTPEEEEFLKTADTFGVGKPRAEKKDEL